jgi:hypothetical protein
LRSAEGVKMKLVRFGIAGMILQGLGVAAFILICRTNVAAVGKPAVVGLTMVAVAMLLWFAIKQAKTWVVLLQLPVLLAIGYSIAFHLVGLLGFRGLLRDTEFSPDYLLSVLGTTGILLVLYIIGATFLYFVDKILGVGSR